MVHLSTCYTLIQSSLLNYISFARENYAINRGIQLTGGGLIR